MGDEWCFALIHSVIHIYSPLANLHVLKTGLNTIYEEGEPKISSNLTDGGNHICLRKRHELS